MGRYYFGQIVGAMIADGRGHTKERPAVIISEDNDYEITGELLVIPITKKSDSPVPYYHIQVHDSHTKDSLTGLYYPCWAKCNWARWIEIRRIHSRWGHSPDDLTREIAAIYDRIFADDSFNLWH